MCERNTSKFTSIACHVYNVLDGDICLTNHFQISSKYILMSYYWHVKILVTWWLYWTQVRARNSIVCAATVLFHGPMKSTVTSDHCNNNVFLGGSSPKNPAPGNFVCFDRLHMLAICSTLILMEGCNMFHSCF